MPNFKIFKTIILGMYKSVEAYRKALLNAGLRVGDWDDDILDVIHISQNQVQLDLVVLSVADLGFKEVTELDKIYAKAKELGLNLCPAEVGPALRLAYSGQLNGKWWRITTEKWFYIAMEPIYIRDNFRILVMGSVSQGGGRWLYGHFGIRHPDDLFVFVLPHK